MENDAAKHDEKSTGKSLHLHGLAWHTLPPDEVAALWKTSKQSGLTAQEAAQRLSDFGENCLPEPVRRAAWLRFLLQFHNPLIYVLLLAGSVTLALGGLVDALVILGVVVINAVIGFVQEGKAERALDAVRGMLAARAAVVRDGERQHIDAAQLVPGDLVLLESGDKIPADLRLIHTRNLQVIESALTGESAPVEKESAAVSQQANLADRTNMCYSGTLVSYGQAQGIVVATGVLTEIGRIGAMVSDVKSLVTPLTRRLDQFARQITAFILGVAAVTLLYGYYIAQLPLFDLFLAVVGLAVAAIPEGMPAIVTIVLAIGTRVMARKKTIVRRLPAVETLGSVSVICTDKTGTLTRNEMTAVRLVLAGFEITVSVSTRQPLPDSRIWRDARCFATTPGFIMMPPATGR
ncbi:HAD-IC family P-type ATPase [Nitrosomonas sp.]|uniref:cation-translocating P-type ATPase n=1 Tax=Nitrosomonas sp. TaxID=42353 RepID=UPI0032EBE60C